MAKIIQTAQSYGVSLWQVIKEPMLFPMDVSKGTMTKIQNFRELIEGWIGRVNTEDAYVLGHDIIMQLTYWHVLPVIITNRLVEFRSWRLVICFNCHP